MNSLGTIQGKAALEVKGLFIARVVILFLALSGALYLSFSSTGYSAVQIRYILIPLTVLFLVGLAGSKRIGKTKLSPVFTHAQLGLDTLVVTALIYTTGGPGSPFLFLYLPLVMVSAVLLSRKTALVHALAASAVYGFLSFLMWKGAVSPFAEGTILNVPEGGLLLQGIGLISAMVLIVIATSYLTKQIGTREFQVQESRSTINALANRHRELMEDLSSAEEQLANQEKLARLLSKSPEEFAADQIRPGEFGSLTGESAVMLKVYNLIDRVAPTDATILIHGESGTGKELVARSIHQKSQRVNGPFVPVNCGAIPENLIESHLFGHKKGSFTGAVADSSGFFKQASGGTIFLDEIGELPLLMQPKLLRAIQEKKIRAVGGEQDVPVDIRVIAATNRNLKKEVEAGRFREDLFYRLNVIGINLPPLKSRKEDLPLLVDAILKKLVKGEGKGMVSPQALQCLAAYEYPGNVRELENILERAYVLGGEVILPEHLPETVRIVSSEIPTAINLDSPTCAVPDSGIQFPVDLDQILSQIERKYIEAALSKTSWAKKKAADLLGINFRSFRYRCQKFGINGGED